MCLASACWIRWDGGGFGAGSGGACWPHCWCWCDGWTPDLFTYKLPVGQLAVITIAAALAGIVAAWLPARRAAKLDVLDAISSV